MAPIHNYKPVWRINIIESERGWGQKINETLYFDTEEEALEYQKKYNSRNTSLTTPEWYIYADSPVKLR
jgi:hypothetical protein